MEDSYITCGVLICYGGFPYNMGDSHVIWEFPVAGNKGEKKKHFFIKLN